jgi:hypothetical protein
MREKAWEIVSEFILSQAREQPEVVAISLLVIVVAIYGWVKSGKWREHARATWDDRGRIFLGVLACGLAYGAAWVRFTAVGDGPINAYEKMANVEFGRQCEEGVKRAVGFLHQREAGQKFFYEGADMEERRRLVDLNQRYQRATAQELIKEYGGQIAAYQQEAVRRGAIDRADTWQFSSLEHGYVDLAELTKLIGVCHTMVGD